MENEASTAHLSIIGVRAWSTWWIVALRSRAAHDGMNRQGLGRTVTTPGTPRAEMSVRRTASQRPEARQATLLYVTGGKPNSTDTQAEPIRSRFLCADLLHRTTQTSYRTNTLLGERARQLDGLFFLHPQDAMVRGLVRSQDLSQVPLLSSFRWMKQTADGPAVEPESVAELQRVAR
jgi:hypothetical protein